MKKHFEVVTVLLLCIVFAGIPVSLYGDDIWDMYNPEFFPAGAVKGTIPIGEGQIWKFVGVKREEYLFDAGYAPWGIGPSQVTKIIHPDPNVLPAIKNWMRRNKVDWAITFLTDDSGYIDKFWVTRYNNSFSDTDEYRNRADAYSTLYYNTAN
jgi:hypothetical protein